MARKPEPHKVMCPYCAELVEVPGEPDQHPNVIVAICFVKNQHCGVKQWGSAATRVNMGELQLDRERTGPAHCLQLDPPTEEETAR